MMGRQVQGGVYAPSLEHPNHCHQLKTEAPPLFFSALVLLIQLFIRTINSIPQISLECIPSSVLFHKHLSRAN